MMILRKQKPEEHSMTRGLWEQIFTEDTEAFLDYYYTEKIKDNEIYVIETDRAIRSMMHLNPYLLQAGRKEVESRYIVAVATEPLYRRKGYMAELLTKAVRDMYGKKIPFTFLMPASEKIYYPHDFRFIYDAEVWEAALADGTEPTIGKILEEEKKGDITLRLAKNVDCKKIAQFAEEILEKKEFKVYAKRDQVYYDRLLKEQLSENGGILIAERDGQIQGTLLFDEEEGFSVREPLVREGQEKIFEEAGILLKRQEKKKPMIMARIVNAEELLSCMTCKEEMEVQFVLVDPVIRENNCLFMLKGNAEHLVVRARKAVKEKCEGVQRISVDALIYILFGYRELEKIEEEEQEQFSEEFKEEICKLNPLSPVFLNEIV